VVLFRGYSTSGSVSSKTYTLYIFAKVAVFEDGGIIGNDLWYPFSRIAIVHLRLLVVLRRATYERHQSTSAAFSTDRQNRTASLPSFIDAKMPSLLPTPPPDHQARPVHHRAIQQLSIRQVFFGLRIPQLGRAKVPPRGVMVTREGSSIQGSLFIYCVCLLCVIYLGWFSLVFLLHTQFLSLFHRADYCFSCQAFNSKVLSSSNEPRVLRVRSVVYSQIPHTFVRCNCLPCLLEG